MHFVVGDAKSLTLRTLQRLRSPSKLPSGASCPEERSTARNIGEILTSSILGKIVVLSLTPVLTRIYSPEDFGVYGLATGVAGMVAAYSGLSFFAAIVTAKTQVAAARSSGVAVATIGVTSLLSLAVAAALPFFGNPESNGHLAIALGILVGIVISLNHVTTAWLSRRKKFTELSRGIALYPIISSGAQLALGIIGMPAGLILGAGVGRVSQWRYLRSKLKATRHRAHGAFSMGFRRILAHAYEIRGFPLYQTPQRIVAEAAQAAPLALLTLMAGPVAGGMYVLGDRAIRVPYNMVASSVQTVMYAEVSAAVNREPRRALTYLVNNSLTLALVAIVAGAAAWGLLPWVVPIVLGDGWAAAAGYGQALVIGSAGALVARPAVSAMPVLERQRFLLIWDTLRAGCAVSVLCWGLLIDRPLLAVYAMSCVQAVFYILTVAFAASFIKKKIG